MNINKLKKLALYYMPNNDEVWQYLRREKKDYLFRAIASNSLNTQNSWTFYIRQFSTNDINKCLEQGVIRFIEKHDLPLYLGYKYQSDEFIKALNETFKSRNLPI